MFVKLICAFQTIAFNLRMREEIISFFLLVIK